MFSAFIDYNEAFMSSDETIFGAIRVDPGKVSLNKKEREILASRYRDGVEDTLFVQSELLPPEQRSANHFLDVQDKYSRKKHSGKDLLGILNIMNGNVLEVTYHTKPSIAIENLTQYNDWNRLFFYVTMWSHDNFANRTTRVVNAEDFAVEMLS